MLLTVTVAIPIPEGFFPLVWLVKYANVQNEKNWKVVRPALTTPAKSLKNSFRMILMHGAGLKPSGEATNVCEARLITCFPEHIINYLEFLFKV